MKLFNIKKAALLLTCVSVVGLSCKKDHFAINTNPDLITETTVDFESVLPASITTTARIVATDWKFLQNWMGYWARSGSFQDITDEETYSFTNDFPGTTLVPLPWNDLYANNTNYNFIQEKAAASGSGFYEAIARIMKAHNFQLLVDIYGNVPYTEALQGNEGRTPKYDNALDIYKDLFRQLDTAITLLHDNAATSPDVNKAITANDLVFQGDATSWIKFANTLKLRLIIHLSTTTFVNGVESNSTVPGIDVAAEAAKITAEGTGFLGAGETAKINPGFTDSKPNPFYRYYVTNENGIEAGNNAAVKANVYAVGTNDDGYYQWNGDPRVDQLYELPDGASIHRGIPFGELAVAGSPNVGSKLSYIAGSGLVPNGASSDAWILTSFESLFLQAEASYRGYITTGGTAESLLTSAVEESFVSLGLTAAQANTYITNNAGYADVDINATPLSAGLEGGGIYTILSQKWFALNSYATYEVWTDYRRSDIVYGEASEYEPGPPISVNPANNKTKLPVRLLYPQNEYNYNPTNVAAQGTIDVFTSKIFWDLN